jgi:predicted phosphodiesterase
MRILILSDIHANLVALEAVLKDAGEIDGVWCLGDLVGYGPDPNECITLIKTLPGLVCLLGNHDAAALGQIDIQAFNNDAKTSIYWLQNVLTNESFAFLMEQTEKEVIDTVTLVHGSPRNPVWEYILDTHMAAINFLHFQTQFCFVGHTHIPVIFTQDGNEKPVNIIFPIPGEKMVLPIRSIVNPGSVGQPRDRNAQAAYAIFDTENLTWESCRTPYDITEVQQRILKAGLPVRHAQRLAEGW